MNMLAHDYALYRSRGLVVSTAVFERQLRSIARAFTPVTLDQVVEASQGARALPPRPVLVTFDDGYRDFADHAAPIAQRLGVPLALFARCPTADARTTWAPLDRAYLTLSRGVVPARIDRDARAALLDLAPDQQLSLAAWSALCVDEVEDARKQLYLDDRAIRALPNDTVRVGAHGRLHVSWTGRSDAWLDAELAACAAWLRSLPNAALALAYPDGAVDDTVALRVRASPFAVAFALDQKAGHRPHAL